MSFLQCNKNTRWITVTPTESKWGFPSNTGTLTLRTQSNPPYFVVEIKSVTAVHKLTFLLNKLSNTHSYSHKTDNMKEFSFSLFISISPKPVSLQALHTLKYCLTLKSVNSVWGCWHLHGCYHWKQGTNSFHFGQWGGIHLPCANPHLQSSWQWKEWLKVINSYLSAMCSAYTGCNSDFLNIPYKPTFEPLSYYAITASTTQMAKRISKLTANRLLKVH